ncbi:PepSY-associated TM helix domain-containing protein [Ferrimonas sp. SCSIO 43195]|uniref:PepSY-associated TM helix domain-containing protein n=1 Tax=Ferrimonas sp. SCSIO 43195 TaxID=2822844 RepID=UPI002074E0A7|nr:PepSY-associated TM helix domain-containing protein [Ferrimonas sp. SCSIO 43195]USD39346.1 PepSY-associated TM helix domain-containing protein [Ferrimonas sp. SCSIO 43195]
MTMLLLALFFAATGLTLNHPDWLTGEPEVSDSQLTLPASLLAQAVDHRPVNSSLILTFLNQHHPLQGRPSELEIYTDWNDGVLVEGELSQAYQGPGYHATVFADLTTGAVEINERDAGIVATLNDLHKGRYSGGVWSLVIDISAVLMILFVVSGALLVLPNRRLGKKLLWFAAVGSVLTALLALTTR